MLNKKRFIIRFMLIVCICILFFQQAYSQTEVTISSIEPSQGFYGTVVKITGTGFLSTDNTVIFRSTGQSEWFDKIDVDSPDGNTLTYTIPSYLSLSCHYDAFPCEAANLIVTPGLYDVYIGTITTIESNIVSFTVPFKTGDVDNSGTVNILDALMVAQYYVGLDPANLVNFDASDVNCDAGTNIVDALLISQFYVGLIIELQECSLTT